VNGLDWAGHTLPSVSFFSSKRRTPCLRPTHGIRWGIGLMHMFRWDMASTLHKPYLRLNTFMPWLYKTSR
jgi:hypothetical protein